MKNEKKEYTAPQLTAVTVKAEHGYAASGLGLNYEFTYEPCNESQETWTSDDSYFDRSWS